MSAEEALDGFYEALLEDDVEDLYERAPIGYLSTTADGLIIKVNETFLTWTGYSHDELVGRRRLSDLLSAGGRIYHETHYAPLLQMQGQAREIALDIVRADGSKLPALINSALMTTTDPKASVIRTAVFDATERRGYERELMFAKLRAEESEAKASLLAKTLQRTLIPPSMPEIYGLDVAGVYRPAGAGDEVGGDFYDVFEVGLDDWVLAIGDVQGKGVEAAVVTTLIRYTIRAAAARFISPCEVLKTLNDVMLRDDNDRLCTVVVIRLLRIDERWTATIGLAGHASPILIAANGEQTSVGSPGALIGVFPEPEFTDFAVDLSPGDLLVAFTDGVTEGRTADAIFGEDRLDVSIARHATSPTALAEGIVADVLAFQGGDARDDIAVVALGVR